MCAGGRREVSVRKSCGIVLLLLRRGERLRAAASTYVALSLAVAGVQKTRQAWFESGVEW